MAAALVAAVGLQAAGATASAVSSYYQGKWAKQLAEYNAKVATLQGKYAIERGQQTEARARIATNQMQGAQRSAYAGQNVLVDDGTALEAQADAAKWGEIDALTIRNNAALEAWGFKQSATNSRIQGQMAYAQGVAGAVGSILGGAGQVAGTMSAAK